MDYLLFGPEKCFFFLELTQSWSEVTEFWLRPFFLEITKIWLEKPIQFW